MTNSPFSCPPKRPIHIGINATFIHVRFDFRAFFAMVYLILDFRAGAAFKAEIAVGLTGTATSFCAAAFALLLFV